LFQERKIIMTALFHTLLYYPILNILIVIYNSIGFQDLGISIILLTLFVRLLIYPLSKKAIKSQQEMSKIQPLLKEIQAKYKDKREEQARAIMALHKEHGVNPFAGFLPTFIQIPVFLALFLVLRSGITIENFSHLYSFVDRPESIHTLFLGIVDLAEPNRVLAFCVALTQFLQSKMILDMQRKAARGKTTGTTDFATQLNVQMTYVFPVILFFISSAFSGGLSLYWTVTNLFSIFQQRVLLREKNQNAPRP